MITFVPYRNASYLEELRRMYGVEKYHKEYLEEKKNKKAKKV